VSKLILIYLALGGIWCSQKTEREQDSSLLKTTHVKNDTVVTHKKVSKKKKTLDAKNLIA